MTHQPSFVQSGDFDWDVLPSEYIPTDQDVQYFRDRIERFENSKNETIKQLKLNLENDPDLCTQLIADVEENHEWFISKYKKQLALIEDALVIYKLNLPTRD